MYRLRRLEILLYNLLARIAVALGLAKTAYRAPLERLSEEPDGELRILFLCKGNICRSPYAAARLRAELARARIGGVSVESAGFEASPEEAANPTGLRVARERGLDTSDHRARMVTAQAARAADLVFVMEPSHVRSMRRVSAESLSRTLYLGALTLGGSRPLVIEDPYGLPEAVFRTCFDQIDAAIGELVRDLPTHLRET